MARVPRRKELSRSLVSDAPVASVGGMPRRNRAKRLDDPRALRALRHELQRSRGTRYHQRLRGLALVAQGMSCAAAARKLGEARRTVYYWVERYRREGFTGLADGRAGRPSRVDARLRAQLKKILGDSPARHGGRGETWSARAISGWLKRVHGVTLRTRQCYRLLAQLGENPVRSHRPGAA